MVIYMSIHCDKTYILVPVLFYLGLGVWPIHVFEKSTLVSYGESIDVSQTYLVTWVTCTYNGTWKRRLSIEFDSIDR